MMKFIPYARQSIDLADIKAVSDALRSDYITQGPRIKDFEEKVASYCGARYAVVISSGTAALHISCLAAEIMPGDEVVTSPITFVASSNCVLYCGGRPVFADIEEDTVNIDYTEIEKKINKNTKAIIPVHFAGHPCDLKKIHDIANRHSLIVIEDAAHALGAKYKGEKVGSCKYSDMAILSFHPAKHITTGEGGMVLTNRKDLYDKLIGFRNHGISRDRDRLTAKDKGGWFYEMQFLGFNYRITDIQCALGLSQMRKLDAFIKRRREIVEFYKKEFSDIKEISCLNERDYAMSSWHIFPIRVKKNRDEIFNRLISKGIGANLHYIPAYLHPYYKKLGYQEGLCPRAEEYYKEAITLPLYPKMTDSEVKIVVRVTRSVINETSAN